MFRLHTALLAVLASLVSLACTVPVPQPPRLTIALEARGRVPAAQAKGEVELRAELESEVQIEATGEVEAVPGPYVQAEIEPASPMTPVPLQGAAVVEFFGIPLEGAQDIVFVLDRSGSMEEFALGEIAELGAAQPPPEEAFASTSLGAQVPPNGDTQAQPPVPVAETELVQTSPARQGPRKIDVAHVELVDALQRLPAGTRINVIFFNDRLEALEASIAPLDEGNRENIIAFVQETFPYGPTALAPAMRTAHLMNARRIVLLSDGLGNVGGDALSVLRDAREAMRGGVRIDTIGLGQDQDASLLDALARESGGIYQRL